MPPSVCLVRSTIIDVGTITSIVAELSSIDEDLVQQSVQVRPFCSLLPGYVLIIVSRSVAAHGLIQSSQIVL